MLISHVRKEVSHSDWLFVCKLKTNPRTLLGYNYRVFSHDVTAAIFVSQNNEMAAMLVSQTSPVGVELFSCANAFFCYNLHICWPREKNTL